MDMAQEKIDLKPQQLKSQPRSEMKANDLLTLKALAADMNTQKIGQGEKLSRDDQELVTDMIIGAGSAIPPGADADMPKLPVRKMVTETPVTVYEKIDKGETTGVIDISGPAPGTTGSEQGQDSAIFHGAGSTLQPGAVAKQQIRIAFTGRSGAGKSFLAEAAGLQVVEIDSQIFQYLKQTFPTASEADLQNTAAKIRWWGEGVISNAVPVTIERLIYTEQILKAQEGAPNLFGNPGFWVRRLVAALDSGPPLVVTQVETTSDLRELQAAGFKHYHVFCSTSTLQQRKRRANADERLANALDQNVTQKLSQSRQGERLKCVWVDDRQVIPNAQRLYSVQDFVNAVNAAKSQP